jgi:hypothetical protein
MLCIYEKQQTTKPTSYSFWDVLVMNSELVRMWKRLLNLHFLWSLILTEATSLQLGVLREKEFWPHIPTVLANVTTEIAQFW